MKINSALLALALNNFVARMNYKLRFVQPKKTSRVITLLSVSVHKFMFHFIISKFLRVKLSIIVKFACSFKNIRDEQLVFEMIAS